jgi:heme/copper-type cytochrome/quinol oxidase subunit 2
MWWRLAILAVITGAILFGLFAPMQTVTIKVDLPPMASPPSAEQVQNVVMNSVWAINAAIVAVVLGVAGLIGWRIVRRHRHSN